MDIDFIRQRITDLRIKKGVSEYKMSLEEVLYICEYLNVTPKAFFDDSEAEPILVQKALDGMHGLSDKDLLTLIGLIDRLKEGRM